ncbi:asparagine synthase (glutamine-hydrolyzing) [Chitinophaga sp. 212800010-3]|uniref:asparagine synthase (glutamine-hydrolyzing) n=1 Tax=unclassified Chitinophaga TaxID=2619133 RepID=UPI002DF21216|nr:Glutamine amidotransferase type-2 domain-containing protein [Chitinophaga sp. 212800010-3]
MCGIVGIVQSNQHSLNEILLKQMTDAIVHRGPDGAGHWINSDNRVGLGHRRLSIIDLSDDGKQPMHYAHSRYTITFNGEIYNYIEIKNSLIKKGYNFTSASDTEVLLALYDAEKENCLSFLDGMFAFAIWDSKENTLFFARDRFGEKPFHYSYEPGKYFVFSSEMKSLWAYGIPRRVNNSMLYRYLVYGQLMNPGHMAETFYDNIYRLEAAHYGKIDLSLSKPEIKKYWDIDYTQLDHSIRMDDAVQQFQEYFRTSVARRLRSDVAVGSSLSGGLDSSLVVCMIDEINKTKSGGKQLTFSARFPGYKKDEGPYMQKVIDRTNVEPHFIFPGEKDMISSLPKLAWHQEEPFGSSSIFAQYEVMRLAKDNAVTVLLDGQGADEIMAGYHFYYFPYFTTLKQSDKGVYKEQLKKYLELQKENSINQITYKPGIKQWVKQAIPGSWFSAAVEYKLHKQHNKASFLNRDFYQGHNNLKFNDTSVYKDLNQILYQNTTGAQLQVLLRYADRNSMAHSREVRLPFLYHEMVEFLFRLPPIYKIQNGWTKYIMRESFKSLLPDEITWRKDKIGYEPPQATWMENKEVKDMVGDFKSLLIKEKILDHSTLAKDEIRLVTPNGYEDRNWMILMTGLMLNPSHS